MLNVIAQTYLRGLHRVPEVAKSAGPHGEAVPSGGDWASLFSRHWAAIINRQTERVELYQETPGGWVERPIPAIPHPTLDIRHLALAFDQSARHVLAYEHNAQIHIRQWDPVPAAFVFRGPFVGVDPVLINDAEANFWVPDSDVLLLYLAPDRLSLRMRVQRELYATERILETFSSPRTLDITAPVAFQWQAEGDQLTVRSDMYPVHLGPEAFTTGQFVPGGTGNYRPVVLVRDVGTEALTTGQFVPGGTGNYRPVVVVRDVGTEALTTGQFVPGGTGNYRPVVLVRDVGTEALTTGQFVPGGTGNYRLVVVVVDVSSPPEVLTTGAFRTTGLGGSYVPV